MFFSVDIILPGKVPNGPKLQVCTIPSLRAVSGSIAGSGLELSPS